MGSGYFLKAAWRKLVMMNYVIDPQVLTTYVPRHTELDFWNGKCYVSLVGFMFQNTQVKGIRVPWHVNFEEVNLRFYVRYKDGEVWKRGVVFVNEIVPKPLISWIANTLYNEHYLCLPMHHEWIERNHQLEITYSWKKKHWHHMKVIASPDSKPIEPGSEEEFITEHYWGYTKVHDRTSEYEVEHPRWEVYPIQSFSLALNFEEVYGSDFAFLNNIQPHSVFLAEGSAIGVKKGKWITGT